MNYALSTRDDLLGKRGADLQLLIAAYELVMLDECPKYRALEEAHPKERRCRRVEAFHGTLLQPSPKRLASLPIAGRLWGSRCHPTLSVDLQAAPVLHRSLAARAVPDLGEAVTKLTRTHALAASDTWPTSD